MFPSSSLDQPIRQLATEEAILFDEVDQVVARATVIGDPHAIFEYGLGLLRSGLIRAHALAKLLYKTRTIWEMFGIEDTFEDVVYEQMGIATATTSKYVRMWDAIFENEAISSDTKKLLMGRPIRDLLMLTAAAREGSLDNEQLSQAALAPDRATIRNMIREARGEATSSNTALIISLEWRDNAQHPKGTLIVSLNGESVAFGMLDVDSNIDAVKRAVERIINSSGILERS